KLRPASLAAVMAMAVFIVAVGATTRAASPPPQEPARAETTRAEPHEAEGGGLTDVLARIVNFSILAGTLFYLLKSPVRTYLADRGTTIRRDLVNAAESRQAAAEQIAEIDRRMSALPGELEALRAQGAQEITAEEARIRAAAASERERLLEQARRE